MIRSAYIRILYSSMQVADHINMQAKYENIWVHAHQRHHQASNISTYMQKVYTRAPSHQTSSWRSPTTSTTWTRQAIRERVPDDQDLLGSIRNLPRSNSDWLTSSTMMNDFNIDLDDSAISGSSAATSPAGSSPGPHFRIVLQLYTPMSSGPRTANAVQQGSG